MRYGSICESDLCDMGVFVKVIYWDKGVFKKVIYMEQVSICESDLCIKKGCIYERV